MMRAEGSSSVAFMMMSRSAAELPVSSTPWTVRMTTD